MAPVAVITGGSQGLGFALAEGLVRSGWAVVVDARRRDRLDVAVARLRGLVPSNGGSVIGVVGDVTDPGHRAAVATAAKAAGPVRALVNNASTLGTSPLPAVDETDPDVMRRTFDVNVVAPAALIAELAGDLAAGAAIVNISSDAALGAYEGWSGYGSSKAALDQVSRVLAAEHPEWRVLSIDPGDMATEMHQAAFPGEDISDRPSPTVVGPAIVAIIEGDQPSGRYLAQEMDR